MQCKLNEMLAIVACTMDYTLVSLRLYTTCFVEALLRFNTLHGLYDYRLIQTINTSWILLCCVLCLFESRNVP